MKTKKIILFLMSVLFISSLIVGLAACNGVSPEDGYVTPGEPRYRFAYSSQFDGENDPDVLIDGKLDEAIWQNKRWYTSKFYTDLNDNMPMISVAAFNTEYGAYMGVKVRDNNIIYNGMLYLDKNSLLEFYFYADKNDEIVCDNDYSLRRAFMMDYAGELYSTGERMKRAITVDGEINSGNTVGATFEIFIPWSEMGIDTSDGVYPQKFYLLPEYRPILRGNTAHTPLFNVPFNLMNHISTYYVFDKNGYTDEDAEGAIVGDAFNGTAKSANWDIENVAQNEVSVTSGTANNTIFFKEAFCENFVAETTLYPLGGSKSDSWWVGGFIVLSTNGNNYMMTIDMRQSRLKEIEKDKKYALKQYALWTLSTRESPYLWDGNFRIEKENPEAQGNSVPEDVGVKFKIIKNNKTICYFVNDEYLYSETLDILQGAFYVGLYNMNAYCAYKDLSFRKLTAEEAAEELNDLNVYNVDINVSATGGKAEAICNYVNADSSAEIKFSNQSGYKLSSVLYNGNDITETVKANAVNGTYALENISENIKLDVSFEKIQKTFTYKGFLLNGDTRINGKINIVNKDCGIDYYVLDATVGGGFEVELEAGEYAVSVNGYNGSVDVDLTDNVENDVLIETYSFGTELYSGTSMYRVGDKLTYKVQQTGAMVIEDVEIEQNKSFIIYADIKKCDVNGVGFVVGTLGEDNSSHLMFNWRPVQKDIYVTRENYSGKWGWKGVEDKTFACNAEMGDISQLALVYRNGMYLFTIDGELVANIPEDEDVSWGVVPKNVIGTNGNKKIGLSVLIGTAFIDNYGYSTDESVINEFLSELPLYKAAKIGRNSDGYAIDAPGRVGAFILGSYEVEQGKDYMISVKLDEVRAENVGFVVGTLGENNANHVMFDWRNQGSNKDIYIWRNSPYGWKGVEDNAYPCTVARGDAKTLAFVYKNGNYYMFINGTAVLTVSEDQTFAWSTVKFKELIGTEGKIKVGLTTSFGSATFSDFTVTTDADKINELVPDEEQELEFTPVQNATKLYAGSLTGAGNKLKISASGEIGAFILGGYEVEQGKDYMISVKIDEVSAENVGFVVGTLGENNANHVMFDWRYRSNAKDIYVWRNSPYGWKGTDDNLYPCNTAHKSCTIVLVYKSGKYHMFVDGTEVFNKSATADIGWGTVINNLVGTEGKIKIGLTTSYGSATFSDFTVTTDADAISKVVPD